jgi:hypothetical protein
MGGVGFHVASYRGVIANCCLIMYERTGGRVHASRDGRQNSTISVPKIQLHRSKTEYEFKFNLDLKLTAK